MTSRFIILFRTERLIIRTATVEDADLFHALWTSPTVMANVGFPRGLPVTRDEIKDRLSNEASEGSGALNRLLVVELKGTGQAIGECHLSRPDDAGVAEPDVKLLPAFWGHKYGAEVWRALVDYQFTNTDCEIVQGTPNVENVASIRMQESAGAVRVGEGVFEFPESQRDYAAPVHHYVYQVYRADWERWTTDERSDESRSV